MAEGGTSAAPTIAEVCVCSDQLTAIKKEQDDSDFVVRIITTDIIIGEIYVFSVPTMYRYYIYI